MYFGRVATAMVTPFNAQGQVNEQATEKLVNHLLNNGTEAIVVAGTTGESPTLTYNEKVALFRHVVEIVNGRAKVIAGTGSNNTQDSIQLTREAEQAGVDAIMLVCPYYNKPSQEGMYQHFKAIAESTSLPIMLYNIPGRSVVNLSVETTVRLSKIPNIVATKEASGNLEAMAQIIEQTADDFYVYSGDDSLTLPLLSVGGTGIVSVAAHVIGKEMQEMIASFFLGEVQRAAELHRQLLPLMNGLFTSPNPVPVKHALNWLGVEVGSVRLPLIPLNNAEQETLETLLKQTLSRK